MEEKLKELLENVPDSYRDLVVCVMADLKGEEEKTEMMIKYLEENPKAQSDDVLDYLTDELGL